MFTKSDLKEIRKAIREEIEAEGQNIKDGLQAEMKINLIRTLSEIREVKDRLKNVEVRINKIQKDLSTTIDFFDKDNIKLNKKVERIEEHLHLNPSSI